MVGGRWRLGEWRGAEVGFGHLQVAERILVRLVDGEDRAGLVGDELPVVARYSLVGLVGLVEQGFEPPAHAFADHTCAMITKAFTVRRVFSVPISRVARAQPPLTTEVRLRDGTDKMATAPPPRPCDAT